MGQIHLDMDGGKRRAIAQRRGEYCEVFHRILGQQQHPVVGAEAAFFQKSGKPVGQRIKRAIGERFVLIDAVDKDIFRLGPGIFGHHLMKGFCVCPRLGCCLVHCAAGVAPGQQGGNPAEQRP